MYLYGRQNGILNHSSSLAMYDRSTDTKHYPASPLPLRPVEGGSIVSFRMSLLSVPLKISKHNIRLQDQI